LYIFCSNLKFVFLVSFFCKILIFVQISNMFRFENCSNLIFVQI
jgi:hypothetical protein